MSLSIGIVTNTKFVGSFDVANSDSAFNYKLACITSLYIALKVYNRKTVRTLTLSELSQGEITPSDITDMEYTILKALSYHLCPPTAWNFVGTDTVGPTITTEDSAQ